VAARHQPERRIWRRCTANLKALEAILSVGLKVEFGGGIRDEETIRIPLEMGVERVFLGTAAIQNPALVDWAIGRYGPTGLRRYRRADGK
jgi:phosphoribosylformimino-5-aminoimidazole carboxamide ribonucleotide (ProFAR) isomerase